MGLKFHSTQVNHSEDSSKEYSCWSLVKDPHVKAQMRECETPWRLPRAYRRLLWYGRSLSWWEVLTHTGNAVLSTSGCLKQKPFCSQLSCEITWTMAVTIGSQNRTLKGEHRPPLAPKKVFRFIIFIFYICIYVFYLYFYFIWIFEEFFYYFYFDFNFLF